ncbi:hypothetical protein DRE_02903 [Drechslerella stenobrocha 248]|uniref:Uncharacterized protein n=1 Tax=Drechslerella stenobrocha 248 TaxID=1043628 RepID=W7I6B2_9PEZI|nr:hypothetical protein DRE_02903 [Drechslerella stenobrocha 248]
MSANVSDPEKNAGLPNLADVYGGIEDNGNIGGIHDESDAIATPASSNPKQSGDSGSWFTKKRIIIIAVIAVVIVAGAVGGAVGGVLSGRNRTSEAAAGSTGNQSPDGSSVPSASTGSGSLGASPTSGAGGNGGSDSGGGIPAASTLVADPAATGVVFPPGVTAVAFSGVPSPSASPQAIPISRGFPGLGSPDLSSSSLVLNGDFKRNLSGWENPDGCWDVNNWDDSGYFAAWNGDKPGGRTCQLAQTLARGSAAGQDTDYVVSFLYRNSASTSSDRAWLWAYIGDQDVVSQVLATNERSPRSEGRQSSWNEAAYKYTVKANQRARIVFRGYNDAGYWEISAVQVVSLDLLNSGR